jgi:hypothetical protein
MTKYTTVIGTATANESIARLWNEHFQKLYSAHNNDQLINDNSNYVGNNDNLH